MIRCDSLLPIPILYNLEQARTRRIDSLWREKRGNRKGKKGAILVIELLN